MKLKLMVLFLFLCACAAPAPDYTVDKHFIAVVRAELINAELAHHKVKTAGPSIVKVVANAMISIDASIQMINTTPAAPAQKEFKNAMRNCFRNYAAEYNVYITGTLSDLTVAEQRTVIVCQTAIDELNDDMLRVGVTNVE